MSQEKGRGVVRSVSGKGKGGSQTDRRDISLLLVACQHVLRQRVYNFRHQRRLDFLHQRWQAVHTGRRRADEEQSHRAACCSCRLGLMDAWLAHPHPSSPPRAKCKLRRIVQWQDAATVPTCCNGQRPAQEPRRRETSTEVGGSEITWQHVPWRTRA